MASLAGMLQAAGFRVTGSDASAYPPMSDFLHSLGIPMAQPFAARTWIRRLISWLSAMLSRAAMSSSSMCSISAFRFARCRNCCTMNSCAGKKCWSSPARTARPPRPRCSPGFSTCGSSSFFPDRRHRGKFRPQLSARDRESTSSSKATSTTPPSSTRVRSSCTTFRTRSS